MSNGLKRRTTWDNIINQANSSTLDYTWINRRSKHKSISSIKNTSILREMSLMFCYFSLPKKIFELWNFSSRRWKFRINIFSYESRMIIGTSENLIPTKWNITQENIFICIIHKIFWQNTINTRRKRSYNMTLA